MERIKYLLTRYLTNQADQQEIQEMLVWLRENEHNESLLQEVWETQTIAAAPVDLQRMWKNIEASTLPVQGISPSENRAELTPAEEIPPVRTIHPLRRYWPVAAAVLLLLASGTYLFVNVTHKKNAGFAGLKPLVVKDIGPGKNGAYLYLADGTFMLLDSAENGVIASQKGTTIVWKNGKLEYDEKSSSSESEIVYNTVSTPRGRQFNLVLPDGSKVWLNAESSIQFPTAFNGKERRVKLSGEAYFEIAKDKNRPFFVNTDSTQTEVLGTSMNINAYDDEDAVKTTLLTGSVRTYFTPVTAHGTRYLLQPGQQSQLDQQKKWADLVKVDPDQVIAWKNGSFNFQNIGLKEVMRQLARWYNLEIVYEKNIPNITFGGEMSRNIPLSDLLDGLKNMDIHFKLEEGRKLIVMP